MEKMHFKKTVIICAALVVLFSVFAVGCVMRSDSTTEPIENENTMRPTPIPEPTVTPTAEPTKTPTPNPTEAPTPTAEPTPNVVLSANGDISDWTDETAFFTQIPDSYYFGSGAGGWKTILNINDDGSFTGNFHDWSAMGPDGIMGYQVECNFSGQFGNVEKVADHTYTIEVIRFQIEGTEGERYLDEQGTTHETTRNPYGFNDASLIYVYTPGTEIATMPEKFVNWYGPNGWPELYDTENGIITKFALYNYYGGYGFFEWEEVPPYGLS